MRLRRGQRFALAGMGGLIIIALCFMLLLPLRVRVGASVHDCGAPLAVLTDSGSSHGSNAQEQKCEHHANLRFRNLAIVVGIAGLGSLAIVFLGTGGEEDATRRTRRPPRFRRFP